CTVATKAKTPALPGSTEGLVGESRTLLEPVVVVPVEELLPPPQALSRASAATASKVRLIRGKGRNVSSCNGSRIVAGRTQPTTDGTQTPARARRSFEQSDT